ncbi:hypothetical protein [Burkholderia savannae]|uniref:hypothetical protein n=1 Tax=Burkholderia savannae TaxID=1637837 RepID=UPI0012F4AC1C|nr:hypothetical protein [Burkholderia savannae]
MTAENGSLIKWLRTIAQAPLERDPLDIAHMLLHAAGIEEVLYVDEAEEEKRLVAAEVDAWARAYVAKFPVRRMLAIGTVAYEAGKARYLLGFTQSENPYPMLSSDWHDCDAGWCDAANEDGKDGEDFE